MVLYTVSVNGTPSNLVFDHVMVSSYVTCKTELCLKVAIAHGAVELLSICVESIVVGGLLTGLSHVAFRVEALRRF